MVYGSHSERSAIDQCLVNQVMSNYKCISFFTYDLFQIHRKMAKSMKISNVVIFGTFLNTKQYGTSETRALSNTPLSAATLS